MLFGLSMAGVTALCLLISPAQSRAAAACDAISPVFALLTAAIAAAMVIAALTGTKIKAPFARLLTIGGLGLAAAGVTVASVITKIMSNTAARTLLIFIVLTALTGLIQTRMFSFSGALGAPLAAIFVAHMAAKADRFELDLTKALARVGLLALLSPLFIPAVIGFAFPTSKIVNEQTAQQEPADTIKIECSEPAALRALDAFPGGFVITQIDLGAPTLTATRHSVTSAPYHRNEKGLLAAINVYLGTPDEARAVARNIGADYLIACADFSETKLFTKMEPDGLLAGLVDGTPPEWLAPLPLPKLANGQNNPVLAYRIKSAE